MDPLIEEQQTTRFYNPITLVLQFLASYGWYLVGAAAAILYLIHKLRPRYEQWRQAREDAEYHKDPDTVLARMQAIQAARERQQRLLEEASVKALQEQKEREERKRAEVAEKLKNLEENGGQRLGAGDGEPYYIFLAAQRWRLHFYIPPTEEIRLLAWWLWQVVYHRCHLYHNCHHDRAAS